MKVYPPINGALHSAWKILVIDDDQDDLILVKEMLREARGQKFDVQWAATYQAGREALLADHFNAVLVDYDLGPRTGIDLIREANERGYPAPLILFTGRGSYEVDVEAMQAGATLYLTKDEANPLLLERGIRYAIDLKQKERELRLSKEALERELAERRRVEKELRFSKERYRVAAINAPIVYAQTDRELRYQWIHNPHPDFQVSDVIGKRDDELEDNEGTRRLVALKQQVLDRGVGLREELIFHRSDGAHIYDMTIEPLRDPEGQIVGVTTASLDITGRKQSEAALRESEARLRALISASSQVLYRMSPDWSEMRQLQGGNFLADTEKPNPNWMAEYIHPEDQKWVQAEIDTAVRTGTVFDLEHRVLRADGTIGWTTSRAVPVWNAEGEIVEWFGAASDITERKQAEEALRESEQRYAALFNARTNGIAHCRVITGEQGQPIDYEIVQVNNAYEEITGIRRADIEGRLAREVFPGIEHFSFDYIGNYGKVGLYGGELNFEVFFEATRQWLSIYVYSPKVGEFTAIFTDISQRKQAEAEQREQAIQIELQRRLMDQREQDRSVIARDLHDGPIQTLSSTLFHIQMIKDIFPDAALQAELAHLGMDIQSTIRELRGVMNDLRPPTLITFGFSKVLEIYLEELRPRFPHLDIELSTGGDDSFLSTQAHLTLFRIFQAGMNNILRHSNASKVWVVFTIEPSFFYFELRDNGVGFELTKDFSQFALEGQFGLVGMRERAEAIGAEFSVSAEPNQGTTLVVKGPYSEKNLK